MKSNETRILHLERDGDPKFSKKWMEQQRSTLHNAFKQSNYESTRNMLAKVIEEDNLDLDVDNLLDSL